MNILPLLHTLKDGFMMPAGFNGMRVLEQSDGMAVVAYADRPGTGLLQCSFGQPGELADIDGREAEIADVEIGRLQDWIADGLPTAWNAAYGNMRGYAWGDNPWAWRIRWRFL